MGWKGYQAALARDPEGVKAVLRIAQDIPHTDGRENMSPSLELELAHIIERESGWRPDIQNAIGATGLIQFIPETAKTLGTTVQELKAMSLTQQAKWVRKYFDHVLGAVGPAAKPGDLYMATFYPKYSHAANDVVIAHSGSKGYELLVWEQNPGLRCSPDGPITVGCVRNFGTPSTEPPGGLPYLEQPGPYVSGGKSGGVFLGILLVALLAAGYKKVLPF